LNTKIILIIRPISAAVRDYNGVVAGARGPLIFAGRKIFWLENFLGKKR